jgi:hypothetical protein
VGLFRDDILGFNEVKILLLCGPQGIEIVSYTCVVTNGTVRREKIKKKLSIKVFKKI